MPPLFPPPAGYQWELRRSVNIWDAAIGGTVEANINFGLAGGNTYSNSANYGPAPDPIHSYELETWYYAQFQMYENHVATEIAAVSPTEEGASHYVRIVAPQRYYTAPPAVWPETFQYTFINTVPPVTGLTSIGAALLKWVGDVWAPVPTSSNLATLNPNAFPPSKIGLQITWPRKNTRADLTRHTLGTVVGLTWPHQWDGQKPYFYDGVHLTVDHVQNAGGYTVQADYRFTKIPGTDANGTITATGGGLQLAYTDISLTDVEDRVTG